MSVDVTAFQVVPTGGLSAFCEHLWQRGQTVMLVVDGASVEGLPIILEQTRLPVQDLFLGSDAEILAAEMPRMVELPAERRAVGRSLIDRLEATPGAAFVVTWSSGELDRVRRQLRKWLSVRLPQNAAEWTEEDKPVLFRYYDPRILAIFLATLTPAEALAFTGPLNGWAIPGKEGQGYIPTSQTLSAVPAVSGTEIFRIRPEQYLLLAQHSKNTFETALENYLRDEFQAETRTLSDEAMQTLIAQAVADGKRLGDSRPGSVASLAVLRLLRPDLLESEFVWSQVMGGNPQGANPNQRVNLLESYHFTDFKTVEEFDAFYARLARFWDFY